MLCIALGLVGCSSKAPLAPVGDSGATESTEKSRAETEVASAVTKSGPTPQAEMIFYAEPKGSELYPKADETIDMKELAAAMNADRKATIAKYGDKVVEVRGRVTFYFGFSATDLPPIYVPE